MIKPFDGADFEENCEDCNAPAGALCYSGCPSGYTAESRQHHVEQIERAAWFKEPKRR